MARELARHMARDSTGRVGRLSSALDQEPARPSSPCTLASVFRLWETVIQDPRTAILRSMLPLDGVGLEIGPGYNPLLPKAEGFAVETADYTDADHLRQKYSSAPGVDIDRIETVDHVLDGSRSIAD